MRDLREAADRSVARSQREVVIGLKEVSMHQGNAAFSTKDLQEAYL